ncbi:Signal transduction histidine kinase [Parapedobacter luteus]|uniref:histidine kinase n=1 Tax=Parapedobacter luteus TaxID=623280 RepID=A0A1T5D979_9SPHI|nr:response regulator [Parapedobacter luteus]SKB68113.1 Signal transduction histidine kinase [Parapedobacter luteus]
MYSKANANLKTGFGLSILLLIISSVISYICIDRLLHSSEEVRRTHEVTRIISQTISSIREAESAQRGYLLTGNLLFMDPYSTACRQAHEYIDQVLQLTRDNPAQQETGRQLKETLSLRIARMNAMIETKQKTGAINTEDMEAGRTFMINIHTLADQMISEENRLLDTRTTVQNRFATYTPGVIVLAALLAILVAVVFYIRIVRDMAVRRAMALQLEQKEWEMQQRIDLIQGIAAQISAGDYTIRINDEEKDALGSLAGSLNRMAESLALSFERLENNEWLQSGVAELNEKMVGEKQVDTICTDIINFLAEYTDSKAGALYLINGDTLFLESGYALQPDKVTSIAPGEGIAGQCMLSQKAMVLDGINAEAVVISHATGAIKPGGVIAFPIFHERKVIGVIELAALDPFTPNELAFFNAAAQNIGTAIYGAQSRKKLQELLEETQTQAEELQAQHSELENLNTELEAHAQRLQASEEELRVQQEELQQNNLDLEERNRIIRERNAEIMKKAKELELSTQYKTEFMANMSHELRTPLNSILLLSRYLAENSEQNLTDDQKESASVIYNSGNGLLQLIDELLDLSKIEAGKMDVEYTTVHVAEVLDNMESTFIPVANDKKLELQVINAMPQAFTLEIDKMKLEQILKNLLSNALKFTSEGHVKLTVNTKAKDEDWLEFTVEDTGVGIPSEKLWQVFEAFTQADGSTKRKYGGTGLGLSISRQLARLLGGDIDVSSELGKGSIFTLTVPVAKPIAQETGAPNPAVDSYEAAQPADPAPLRHIESVIPQPIPDDRSRITPVDKVILIVEDDTAFAKELLRFTRSQHYRGIVAVRGDEVMELVLRYKPLAILLDIKLPVKDGWQVMEELKSNTETRHIPVHIMSSLEAKKESRQHGAVEFFSKPMALEHMQEMFRKLEKALAKGSKKVLIVEENTKHAEALAYFLESFKISSSVRHSINDSVDSLLKNEADCVILDMGVPDKNAYDLLETVRQNPGLEDVPIIVFTGKSLSPAEEFRIKQYADSIVVKTAYSYQRIIDEVAIFLHLVESQKENLAKTGKLQLQMKDVLHKKTVLIADDDVRNIFSLTKTLENLGMHVVTATDGVEALEQLENHPETDIVLMDMMMPHMDGYESTTKIRQHPQFKDLPVIAVTAKAMLGDREKCITAGASDYISKPVDIDQLTSLLRVWLYDRTT